MKKIQLLPEFCRHFFVTDVQTYGVGRWSNSRLVVVTISCFIMK